MNFISLNVRGISGVDKPDWVRRLKQKYRCVFLCLQETHQAGVQDNVWANFWGRYPFASAAVDAVGRSGGMVSLWDPGVFQVVDTVSDRYYLLTSGYMSGVEDRINVLNVYAPNDAILRSELWDKIVNLSNLFQGLWVAMGDFNDVRSPEERVNSSFDGVAAGRFNDFCRRVGWVEYRMIGGRFTYISDNLDVKMSKLDRVLVCAEVMARWPNAKLEVLSRGLSDHCPILFSCLDSDFGPPPVQVL